MNDELEMRARSSVVVRDYRGVIPQHEIFYVQSILYAADRARIAFKNFYAALVENVADAVIFSLIQEAMTHAGALSRFFWPARKNDEHSQARGKKLRESFGLTDASPLRDRRLRNAFEHFDENLDRYLLKQDTGYFFPDPQVGDHKLADEAEGRTFKLVDPVKGACVLLGQKFLYKPIRKEVENILSFAGSVEKDGRLPDTQAKRYVSPDQAFARFHNRWERRLGLKKKYFEEAFALAQDRKWKHIKADTVPPTPGHTRILVTLEAASLLGSIEPGCLDDMISEWKNVLAEHDGDQRKFTRRFITERIALNRHRQDVADLVLCGVVWLIYTKDDGQEIIPLMRRGDVEIHYDISFEDEAQQTRFRLSVRELKG